MFMQQEYNKKGYCQIGNIVDTHLGSKESEVELCEATNNVCPPLQTKEHRSTKEISPKSHT